MQKEGCGGLYLEGEALGIGISNPLIPLVGIGHLLGSVPHLGGSFQEGADLGRRTNHGSDAPAYVWLTSPSSLPLFSGIYSSPHLSLLEIRAHGSSFTPAPLLSLLWVAQWKGHWLERQDLNPSPGSANTHL